jgi:molybdate transport system substrate-binding protein
MLRRLLALFLLTAPVQAAEVRVLAAASLTDAMRDIARAYERGSRDRIVFSFGASSMLARQIEAGAPVDLFFSADEAKMDGLSRRGLVAARTSVLANTLVIVVPRVDGVHIAAPQDLLRTRSIALAEPSSVPAGIYARSWLQKVGLWSRLRARVIPTDNVRSALAAVAAGNADAAIVYRTDALIARNVRVAYAVPRAQGPKVSYPFALMRDAEEPEAARRFLAFVRSRPALEVFRRHGFDVLR